MQEERRGAEAHYVRSVNRIRETGSSIADAATCVAVKTNAGARAFPETKSLSDISETASQCVQFARMQARGVGRHHRAGIIQLMWESGMGEKTVTEMFPQLSASYIRHTAKNKKLLLPIETEKYEPNVTRVQNETPQGHVCKNFFLDHCPVASGRNFPSVNMPLHQLFWCLHASYPSNLRDYSNKNPLLR